ncbi:hypothetical protein HMPREF1580_00795 [Gardnerella vaginalis JCP8070]|nr:hypothetical protein HMPREF1580_00795 [Gardnerella vaginalis JCP8070]
MLKAFTLKHSKLRFKKQRAVSFFMPKIEYNVKNNNLIRVNVKTNNGIFRNN